MTKPTTVDGYLAALPDEQRSAMEQIRAAVTAGAPGADEVITYGMPGLRSHGGQFLVSYDAFKHHYSLFPASGAVVDELGEEIRPYLHGRGTIRFPADRPIPVDLIRRIVEIRFAENAARDAKTRR